MDIVTENPTLANHPGILSAEGVEVMLVLEAEALALVSYMHTSVQELRSSAVSCILVILVFGEARSRE